MCIRDSHNPLIEVADDGREVQVRFNDRRYLFPSDDCVLLPIANTCLLYTSDAADERSSVDLGGRRILKKKRNKKKKKKNLNTNTTTLHSQNDN